MPRRAPPYHGGSEDRAIRLFFKHQARPVDAPPPGTEFADLLAADDPAAPGARPDEREIDATPLVEAMEAVREGMPGAAGIEDYYGHLDTLSAGVARTFERSFCKAGCSGCCYYPVGLFTISFTEWDLMRRHMETVWSPDERADFARRYREVFTGFWRFLLGQLQNSFVGLLLTAPFVQRARIACPFLKDDRCSIYAARPYQCRTFGLFAARTLGREPKVYACNMQGENLLAQLRRSGPQIQLPVMNPIVLKIRKLCAGPKLALPIWAGIWVSRWEQGRAVPGEGLPR